jgi:hypothetical protein
MQRNNRCAVRARALAPVLRAHASRSDAASPLEHLRFGLDLLLYLLELAATRKHPRLDEALLRCALPRPRPRNER